MPPRLEDRLVFQCFQRWRDLTPQGAGRYCGRCDTVVVDLSRLTRKNARERTRSGACVRIRYDTDGAPIFRAEPAGGLRVGIVLAASLVGGCSLSPDPNPIEPASAAILPEAELIPMSPLPEGLAVEELPDLPTYVGVLAEMTHRGPTPEQRALTAAKRRDQAIQHVEFLGMMEADW